jgi:hypothetical protein
VTTTEETVYGPITVTGVSVEDCTRKAQAIAAETLHREPFVWRIPLNVDVQPAQAWSHTIEFKRGDAPDVEQGWKVGDTEAVYVAPDDTPTAMRVTGDLGKPKPRWVPPLPSPTRRQRTARWLIRHLRKWA